MNNDKLPVAGLLALATIAFSTIITELLPAGVLLDMSKALHEPGSKIGQLVSCYAIGSCLTAIPGSALTRRMNRKPLLLFVLSGFLIMNLITALSTDYLLTIAVRIIAGGLAGISWPLVTSYPGKMVAAESVGKALAIVLAGSTVALSAGLPAGTFLGTLFGWRIAFMLLSCISLIQIILVSWKIPDFPGEHNKKLSYTGVFRYPGIARMMITTFIAVLGTYCTYTFIAPLLVHNGIKSGPGQALFVFGIAAVLGIVITGQLINRFLKATLLVSLSLSMIALLGLANFGSQPLVLYSSTFIWGMSFGGLPTLFQTAIIKAAGPAADTANSIMVTTYNLGIFGGAILGGLILDTHGAGSLSWYSIFLMAAAVALVVALRNPLQSCTNRENYL